MSIELNLEKDKVLISKNISFEDFVNNFQKYTNEKLCILNNSTLISFNKIPDNLDFNYKIDKKYYYRDIKNNLYCFFEINKENNNYKPINKIINKDNFKIITLIDKDKKFNIKKNLNAIITKISPINNIY